MIHDAVSRLPYGLVPEIFFEGLLLHAASSKQINTDVRNVLTMGQTYDILPTSGLVMGDGSFYG